MKSRKGLIIIFFSAFVTFFLIGVGSYYNHQAIESAVEGCEKVGGEVNLEKDFLAINWSFSCEQ